VVGEDGSGLWEFLGRMQYLTGETPKEHLEAVLRMELDCILSNLPDDMFDRKFIVSRFGEGSAASAVRSKEASERDDSNPRRTETTTNSS
jgi:hypothetical protein